MDKSIEFKRLLAKTDLGDGASIERYAVRLKGMTFRDVLNLDIKPDGYDRKNYGSTRYKGGMGNLLEERYFGYKSNSDERPDFPDAGVELKATCYDIRKKDGRPTAGERLSLTMIPYDRPVTVDFDSSHVWSKCHSILLVYYHRDRSMEKYDQRITHVKLFTPPEEDLKIIREDYRTIVSYIRSGRAHELSEGLTTYLGAATKGATAESSLVEQYYPHLEEDGTLVHIKAKKRAFSFKRQYMDYVLHHYLMGEPDDAESIVSTEDLDRSSFTQHVHDLIASHFGKTDREIAREYDLPYTGNKAQWTSLVYRMLGIRGNHAKEFKKAGISVRVVRIEENNNIKENLSFAPFEFSELLAEEWESSTFRTYLEETRFFFVVFKKRSGAYHLATCGFWNMPVSDIEGDARSCWEETRRVIRRGVRLDIRTRTESNPVITNDLPGMADNPIAHVRPHAQKAAYLLSGGTEIGDIQKDASRLPDGRWMTKQSFWFNKKYVLNILKNLDDAS